MRALAILIIVFLFSSSKSWSQEEKSDSFDDLSGSKWPVGGSQRDTTIYDDQSELYVSDPVESDPPSPLGEGARRADEVRGQGEVTEKQCARFAKRSVKRMDKLTARIRKTNDAYLAKFKESENALMQRLCFINEQSAEGMMQDAWYSFNRFENICGREGNNAPKGYFAELDTLTQATNYISSQRSGTSGQLQVTEAHPSPDSNQQVSNSPNQQVATCNCSGLSEIKAANARLKKELKRSEMIGQYMRERQTFLNKALANTPDGVAAMQGMQQCTHYYSAQIKEYKSIFTDRSSIEKLVMGQLMKNQEFAQFMNANGQLALPAGGRSLSTGEGPRVRLEDLLAQAPDETKALMTALQTPAGAKATNIKQALDDTKNDAQNVAGDAQKLKNDLGNVNSESDSLNQRISKSTNQQIPDSLNQQISNSPNQQANKWQPNPLRTKRFIDRIQYGCTFQADRRNYFFPLSGTLAGQTSFQMHKNSNIGLGASWIIGFDRLRGSAGTELPVVKSFASNGLGLRSFIDCRLRGSLYLQGCYEINYRNSLPNPQLLKPNPSSTSESCLLGLKLKYPSSNKRSKPTLEVLYDFMHNRTGQPAFVLRMGVEFNRKHGLKN